MPEVLKADFGIVAGSLVEARPVRMEVKGEAVGRERASMVRDCFDAITSVWESRGAVEG